VESDPGILRGWCRELDAEITRRDNVKGIVAELEDKSEEVGND